MIYFITKQDFESPNITVSDNIYDFYDFLADEKEISLDTETHGLNYFAPDQMLLIQAGNDEDQYVVDVRYFDLADNLIALFENDLIRKIFHNSDYDLNVIKNYIEYQTGKESTDFLNIFCTYKASKILYTGYDSYSHNLETCAQRELKEELDKGQQQYFIKHPLGKDFRPESIYYAAKDIKVTHQLYKIFKQKLADNQLMQVANIENQVPYWKITRNGMPLDSDKWLDLFKRNKIRFREIQKEMDQYLLVHYEKEVQKFRLPLSLFIKSTDRLLDINWQSSQQVNNIFKLLDISVVDKHGKKTTGRKEVEKAYRFNKIEDEKAKGFIELYIKYAELKNLITTFGDKYLYKKDKITKENQPLKNKYTDRVHPTFDPIKSTGRMGQFDPNLQQVPSNEDFRSCFCVKDDKVIITADYSGQESRVMASLAKDQKYIDFFNNGDGDIHSFVATQLFSAMFHKEFIVSKSQNKDYRQKGKILNFMISFGGSAYSLSKDLNLPVEEAQELIDNFFKAFPTLKAFFDNSRSEALKNGYIVTNDITFRKIWFPEWLEYKETVDYVNQEKKKLGNEAFFDIIRSKEGLLPKLNRRAYILKGDIERAAQNYKVQGTAADMTKIALIKLEDVNRTRRLLNYPTFKIINVVHDEIVVECNKSVAGAVKNIVEQEMEAAGKMFCPDVDMKPTASINSYWNK